MQEKMRDVNKPVTVSCDFIPNDICVVGFYSLPSNVDNISTKDVSCDFIPK